MTIEHLPSLCTPWSRVSDVEPRYHQMSRATNSERYYSVDPLPREEAKYNRQTFSSAIKNVTYVLFIHKSTSQ